MNAVSKTGGTENALVQFNTQIESRAGEFQKVLPSHISPERFQRTLLTVATVNPDLLRADRRSLITACMKAAQDGLLPDGREAAIVIFETNKKTDAGWSKTKEAQYMPMVYGLRKKIIQSGEISSLSTQVVYRCEEESGRFIYEEGTEAMLRHKPMLDMTDEQASDDNIIAAYSMVTFKDGSKSYEVLSRRDLNKIQRASKTGSPVDYKGAARQPKGPWLDWYAEMARKSAMRRHSKSLPMAGDILDSLNTGFDDAGAGESVGRTFASATPDAPTTKEIDQLSNHDAETGEIIDDAETDAAIEREAARLSGQGVDDEEEANGANDSIDMIVKQIVDELAARKTVPDINSFMASDSIQSVMSDIGGDAAAQIEAAKNARIAEIQNGGN